MTDYSELVKKLRDLHRDPRPASAVWLFENQLALYDAAAAIEALQAVVKILKVSGREAYFEGLTAEPKRGKWIDRYDEDDKPFFKRKYVCSACGHWNTYGKSNYCPKCGAKMIGEQNVE